MYSVVLDTNVLASGTLSAFTPPGKILDAWQSKEFELLVSEYILSETKLAVHIEAFLSLPQLNSSRYCNGKMIRHNYNVYVIKSYEQMGRLRKRVTR